MNRQTDYDVIIVGGSYAGLSAAMGLGRAMRKVMVIDSGEPCNKQTPHSHNFLTRDGETPAALAVKARQQVAAYETVSMLNDRVTDASVGTNSFSIATRDGRMYTASKLLFATGVRNTMPDIQGFAACWGISVLHCPYCHGYEVRHQPTGILANGDTGYELAKLISQWTQNLVVFTNGTSTMSEEQRNTLAAHNITINEKQIAAIVHKDGYIKQLAFADDTTQAISVAYARPPFSQHCELPEKMGCLLTDDGFLKTDEMRRTSIPGVFAAGDNIMMMRSVANAVAAGAMAGAAINHELIAAAWE